jgi:uncharacterized membrane protein YccC
LLRYKLPVDPYSEDKHARLDTDSDQDHLELVKLFLNTDPHWVLENDLGIQLHDLQVLHYLLAIISP